MITKKTLEAYRKAFDNFRKNTDAMESAILKSTKTNGCSLELFEDATHRILCDGEIGNSYKSPGIIISIPKLDGDDYDEENGQHFFGNAIEEMDWQWETTIENEWEDYLTALSDDWIEEQNENGWDDYLAELNIQ